MTATPPLPTVVAHADANPCPRVEVTISPMPADAASITVYRNYAGMQEPVRDATGEPVAGDFLVVDYEAPFGVLITYTAATADASGTASSTSDRSAAVRLDVADLWLSDPLAPEASMALPVQDYDGPLVTDGTLSTLTWNSDTSVAPVLGGTLPVGSQSVFREVSGVPLTFQTNSRDDYATLLTLLRQATPLLVRPPDVMWHMPRRTYLAVPSISVAPRGGTDVVDWALVGDSVAGPSASVVLATRIYNDLPAEANSYDALAALYGSYLDLQRGH